MLYKFQLRSSEWLLTGSLLLLLASLVAIAKIKAYQAGEAHEERMVTVEVTIQGHVKKPGVYAAARGIPVGQVLRKAQPKKYADLRGLCLKDPVVAPLELAIEPLQELRIQVKGAVEQPGEISIPLGTRISDLKKILLLSTTADLTFFKKKRLVPDGEVINIPSRND